MHCLSRLRPLNTLRPVSLLLAAGLFWLPALATAVDGDCQNCFEKRYVYFSANFDYVEYYNKLMELIPRAKAAGYNGIALASGGSGSFTSITMTPSPTVETRYRDLRPSRPNRASS